MVSLLIFLMLFTQAPLGQEYVAKQGDSVTVTVWERQSLSGMVIVDSNGNITLPMPIGSVSVVGMTAANIAQLLTDKIKEYLVNPTVFVSITPAEGFIVHVLGEVKSPDFIKVPEGSTVQEVITRAGGFTDLADKKHIKLIRKDEKDIDAEIKGLKKINKTGSPDLSTRLKHQILSVEGNEDKKNIRDFVDNYFLARDSSSFRTYLKSINPDIKMVFNHLTDNGEEEVSIPLQVQFFWPDA